MQTLLVSSSLNVSRSVFENYLLSYFVFDMISLGEVVKVRTITCLYSLSGTVCTLLVE